MNKFIYAYDAKTKEELEKNNYEFICETKYKGKKAFLFSNKENSKITFNNNNLEFSNKLIF